MNRFPFVFCCSVVFFLMACGNDPENSINDSEEIVDAQHQIEDEKVHLETGHTNSPELEYDLKAYSDEEIDAAYEAFLQKGVPRIPLKQAFDYYRVNRLSQGGLQDDSCLIMPLSESGVISPKQHRYDPTTLDDLRMGIRNERYIVIVDFTKSRTRKRGYILDMEPDEKGKYHFWRMTTSHGYGSKTKKGKPQIFTNKPGRGTTVSGFHVTASVTYKFYGRSKKKGRYTSRGLRLYGLESTNNTAEKSSKVAHGSVYNSNKRAGNSAGCPAMTQKNAYKWLHRLKGGVLWYHYTKVNRKMGYKAASCKKS